MATTAPSRATDVPLNELAAGVRGALTRSSDPGYDEVRSVYNGAVDRRPAVVVRCADVADVIACTNFARDHDMALAIRGGAHHGGGFGVWDDALVIDLGGLRSTTVSPAAHTVRVDGGCTLGRCRPRHRCVRHGDPRGVYLDNWSRWTNPRWWIRLPVTEVRPQHRQSALCRRRAC